MDMLKYLDIDDIKFIPLDRHPELFQEGMVFLLQSTRIDKSRVQCCVMYIDQKNGYNVMHYRRLSDNKCFLLSTFAMIYPFVKN